MTEEERQRIQAEYLRKAQEQVAMLSQSAMTPEALAAAVQQAGYDPAGKEAMLATMLRGGQEALYGATPKGTEIGDIYVAPTWSESLNAAAQKALGGYQMGRARKEQAAIDEQRAKAASAKEQVAAEAARVKQLQAAESNVTKILDSQGDAARAQAAMDQQERLAANRDAAANNRLTRTLAAKGDGGLTEQQRYQRERDAERDRLKAEQDQAKANEALDTDTRKLTTQLLKEGIPQAETGIQAFYKAIEPYQVKDAKGNPTGEYADIPGLGGVQNISGTVGNAATAAADLYNSAVNGAPESAGRNVKQAYMNVLNRKIKDMSGGQVTVNEWIRNLAAAGSTAWNDEMSAVEGMREIEKALAEQKATVKAGYSDAVINSYNQKLEREKGPAIPTITTEAEYNALPPGAVYIDPDDGKKYRKP